MTKPISLRCRGLNHQRDVPVLVQSVGSSRDDVRSAPEADHRLAT
jgi:hypothetical protein